MRVLTERMKGKNVDLLDGIKVFHDGGWAQVLPDPDEPIVHVYAEAESDEAAAKLGEDFVALVEEAIAGPDDVR
jgi:mannose-1-phosphate guanylyltransferase / phosphomannomutase